MTFWKIFLAGYNFPSLEAIKPFLEPQGTGPSGRWARETARRLRCKVCVGYPEIVKAGEEQGEDEQEESSSNKEDKYYNSLIVVGEDGQVLHNYRKRFLYYTDESWASEGDAGRGFLPLEFGHPTAEGKTKKHHVPTTFGICMDINPYKFEAPFTAWEFANRVLDSQSQLVIVSTAWLAVDSDALLAAPSHRPDMDTFNYWMRRFWPLIERRLTHSGDLDGLSSSSEKRVVLVFANRTGIEESAGGVIPTATYVGTSTVVAITQESTRDVTESTGNGAKTSISPSNVKIHCWGMKGAREEGICFADTQSEPAMTFVPEQRASRESDDGSGA